VQRIYTACPKLKSSMASSDDEDLKSAIALSLKTQYQPEIIDLNSDEDEISLRTTMAAEKSPASRSNLAFLGLDRKKMEQERLARTRKPPLSPPRARKRQKVSGAEGIEPAQHDIPNNVHRSLSKITSSTSRGGIPEARFLNPVVKKTWAFGHPRDGSEIKLEEILQKGDLKSAVLSGFQWDIDWLFAKLDTKSRNPL